MEKQTVSQDNELLTEIAVAYYQDEITQEEIAKKFGISRIKVGRLLKRAKEEASSRSPCVITRCSAPGWSSR